MSELPSHLGLDGPTGLHGLPCGLYSRRLPNRYRKANDFGKSGAEHGRL